MKIQKKVMKIIKEKGKKIKIEANTEKEKVKVEVKVEVEAEKEIEKIEVEVKAGKKMEIVQKNPMIERAKKKAMIERIIKTGNMMGRKIKKKIIEDIKIKIVEISKKKIEVGLMIEEIIIIEIIIPGIKAMIVLVQKMEEIIISQIIKKIINLMIIKEIITIKMMDFTEKERVDLETEGKIIINQFKKYFI